MVGVAVLAVVVLGPWLAPQPPLETTSSILAAPNAEHLLGTDSLGRDVLSRILAGGRTLILMALAAGLISVAAGTLVGVFSGYRGGAWDGLLMRLVDLLISFPPMLVILVFTATFPRNNVVIVALVALLLLPGAARIVRGLTQEIASREFIASAEAAGERTLAIMGREILPNVRGRLAVELALRTGFAALLISAVNFLGVGISPPTPDWGLMVNEERFSLTVAPWATLFPALALLVAISAIIVMADWLDRRWA
jgi:peptide/nickel transport system permease protein